jgi:TPR repeat protein
MSLPPAPSSASGAALGEHEGRRRKLPRHASIAWLEAHPALSLACPDRAFVAELTAHPLYCRASRSSLQRWEAMFRCRTPSQAHAQQWYVYGIDVGLKQRSTLLARAALCELLVLRLMHFGGACRVRYPQHHATCVVSRRHFLVSKNLADGLFQEGQRLCEQPRYSDAAKSWGQAALLQNAASHAFLSDMLIDGRLGMPKNEKRGFELAAAGAAMGCAHSKGVLGSCYAFGICVAKDVGKGLALGRESAAAGSCFGQFVVGWCYDAGLGVAQDDAEAVRLYRLAAAQGHAYAQHVLGLMLHHGAGVAKNKAEAIRWHRLAAAQGDTQSISWLEYFVT